MSPRISISHSFHIKNPELIESIAATKTDESLTKFENEFERRDQAALQIQTWWRKRRVKKKSKKKTPREKRTEKREEVISHKRTKSSPAEVVKVMG